MSDGSIKAGMVQSPPIAHRLERLNEARNTLADELSVLQDRLAPILTPEYESPGESAIADAPAPSVSTVAERIDTELWGIERLIRLVRNLQVRVEV